MRRSMLHMTSLSLLGTLLMALVGCGTPSSLVIAHRGASGYLPEHTLEAYALAAGMGADLIEPDVVMTSDGVAICSHDVELEKKTDVATRFPERVHEDGHYYAWDFTLEEVRTMRRLDADGVPTFPIPTLDEMLDLVDRIRTNTGRSIGVIPEPKRPGAHRARGLDVEGAVMRALLEQGFEGDDAIIQCFELDALRRLSTQCDLPLVFLVGDEGVDDATLDDVASFCVGVGPNRDIVNRAFMKRVRARGLRVYPWTFKDEPDESRRFMRQLGVDGLFTDHPDVARRAR